jgi:hypothetical protein
MEDSMETSMILSIVSLCISAVIGLINVKISIDNHRMKIDEFSREKEKYNREVFDARPRLEIVRKSDNFLDSEKQDHAVDIDCLVVKIEDCQLSDGEPIFIYDKKNLNRDEWVSVEFVLKNVGKSTVSESWFAWNSPKDTALFDVKGDSYILTIQNQFLNYRVLSTKTLKTNDEISIRINFHKDRIMSGWFMAEASIWLFDEYRKIWMQPLFVHTGEIYDSTKKSFKEFKDFTDIEAAMKCFKDPILW